MREDAIQPPSTTIAWPVTNDDSSLASQSAAFAMSSARPARGIGCARTQHRDQRRPLDRRHRQ
jgi:hypothetical protein